MNICATLFRLTSGIAIAAGLALVVGCTSTPFPPAPQFAASPDYLYKIGPGDSVNIVVWRNPELSMTVTVRPDGKITAPLFEDLPAIGKDPTTLARDIEKALSKYVRDPIVTVIVAGGSSVRIRSRFASSAKRPSRRRFPTGRA